MSTHDGYIEWFPWLRIDCFTTQPNPATGKMPLVYLLTHAHSDHLAGTSPFWSPVDRLDRGTFSGKIYLHPLTKELVLNWIEAPERVRYTELGVTTSESGSGNGAILRKPAYRLKNLTKRPAVARNAQRGGGRGRVSVADQMVDVTYNQPFQLEGPNGHTVDVTPIDANHCPGSCMYLIEGVVEHRLRTVLVTGDIRIDCDYLETLRRNPLLAPYIAYSPFVTATSTVASSSKAGLGDIEHGHKNRGDGDSDEDQRPLKRKKVAAATTTTTMKRPTVAVKTLDRIYLDTSQVQLDEKLVSKERAVADLVRLIALYPPDTQFFLNAWTPGYEEMLKGVYRAFDERIHLDWYKARQYTCPAMRATDPLLASLGHCDPHPSVVNSAATAAASSNSAVAGAATATRCPDHEPFVGRFHACERRWKCDQVWQGGVGCYEWDEEYLDQIGKGVKKLVRPALPSADASVSSTGDASPLIVNVNPAEMPEWCWDEYRPQKEKEIRDWVELSRRGPAAERSGDRGGAGPSRNGDKELSNDEGRVPPDSLVVPLARHSSRPELQAFVALFRPRTVYPLTCTNPELFKLLPVIFDERHLAPGGVEQQRAEIAWHTAAWFEKAGVRKRLTAMLNSGLFAAAYGFPARGQERDDDDDDDDTGEGEEADGLKMSKTMANALAKGLNVEGDDRIIEEHLKWLKKVAERHETALVSPQQLQQPAGVIVLSDSDSEGDDDNNDKRRAGDVSAELAGPVPSKRRQSSSCEVARAVPAAAAAVPRQLEFASLSSNASRRMSKLGTGLLPPYSNRMPSPFLAAVDDVTDGDILPHDLTGVDEKRHNGLGSPLRPSDAQKSSRPITASASDLLGGGSSSTTVDSEGVQVRRERRQVVPSPELWPPPPPPPRQTMSVPRLPSTVLSDSTDLLNMKAAGRGAASSPSRSRQPPVPPQTSSSDDSPPTTKRSKGKAKQKDRSTSHLRLEASMSAADAETVAAFYRIQRGKIGSGKIVYFDAGDPRLQGRSSVKAIKASKAAAKAERTRQREKENKAAATISPKSFRTVSASVSISPRA